VRFLMITMQFPTGEGQSYLTTELADELVAGGHEVEVLHLDWAAAPSAAVEDFVTQAGVRVLRCSPRYISGFGRLVRHASKFVLSGRRAARIAERCFDLASFDAAIAWMPAVAIAPLVKMIGRAGIRNRLLFIWDFFPDHHHEIGRVPGGLPLRLARAWEQALLRRFTAIICTLPGNAAYLRRRFHVGHEQKILVTPIWGNCSPAPAIDSAAVRRHHRLPPDAPIAVFGGQFVEGRGFEQMLAAADGGLRSGSNLVFLFVGDGRLAPAIRERAAQQANLIYLPPVSRAEYLELLGACDVGMTATVPGVTSFSIPSKTIDYLRAGLPVVAAVEDGNEFAGILRQYDVGCCVPFGDAQAFLAVAERLATGGRISEAAARCLENVFDVRHAVATVLEAAGRNSEAAAARGRGQSSRRRSRKPAGAPSARRPPREAA
jgi:glycosyltransferase involved in cell wall biosynthesis